MSKRNQTAAFRRAPEWFGALYQVLAGAAVALTLAPFLNRIFYKLMNFPGPLAFVFTLLPMFAGLAMQAFYGKVLHIRRERPSDPNERGIRFFSPKNALLPIVLSAILSFLAYPAVDRYLYRISIEKELFNYDPNSLIPLLGVLAVFLPLLAGIIVWFYPYDRIISYHTIFPFLAVFLIGFIVNFSSQGFITVCFIFFLLCAVLILNQSYIIGLVDRAKVGAATTSFRLYNMALVIVLLLAVAVILLFVISAVVGLTVLFRTLLYFALASIFRDESTSYYKAETVAEAANREIFSNILGMSSQRGNQLYFAIFCVTVAALIVFFLLIRRVNLIKILGSFFSALYNAVLNILANLFRFNTRSAREDWSGLDYRDDEKKLEPPVQTGAAAVHTGIRRTYRDFSHRLNSLKTDAQKLAYAYSTLVSFWYGYNLTVRPSDTPREIRDKVRLRMEWEPIEQVTREFEAVKYAEDPSLAVTVLNEMCSMIRKYYEQ